MAVNKYYQINDDTIRPLVSATTSAGASSTQQQNAPGGCFSRFWYRRRHIFPKSKPLFMILLWNIIVGVIYGWIIDTIVGIAMESRQKTFQQAIFIVAGGYALVSFAQILSYPVGGLLADLCCGRLRIVFLSLFKIWVGFLLLVIVGIVAYIYYHNDYKGVLIGIIIIAYLLLLAGFTGFQVNAVQFGLDQLLDSPSQELSAFLHWFLWTQSLGELLIRLFAVALPCNDTVLKKVLPFFPLPMCLVIGVMLAFTCFKRGWFHSEPRTHNPYGTVYRVLKFAAQHNRPLRRSAFAYCDDERPSRIEFAKQRFGGPFTTETVEDVRTFLRILIMLFLIAPVFNLQISTTYLFPLYGLYMGVHAVDNTNGCKVEWMLLQSGNLSFLISLVFIPLYLVFVHPRLIYCMPRILHRLVLFLAIIVVTVAVMFGLLAIAKYSAIRTDISGNNKTCIFLADQRFHKSGTPSAHLDFHLPLLIVPNLLTGIAVPLIYITILEFISAQSPHTMKGLLLGVFYACRGLFIMVGNFLLFIFAKKKWWTSTASEVYDCGFSYYLTSTLLGVIGIIVVSLGVKWYHFRKRQDRPYDPSYVENYYQRYSAPATSPDGEEEPLKYGHIDTSILTYGTMVGT